MNSPDKIFYEGSIINKISYYKFLEKETGLVKLRNMAGKKNLRRYAQRYIRLVN